MSVRSLSSGDNGSMMNGEFFTDGNTFVFRLSGTPLSGMGSDPAAAFRDLMRVDSEAKDFAERFKELARDQQSETVRAAIIRYVMIALIIFSVVGGSLAAGVAMLPKVTADVSAAVYSKLSTKVAEMQPEKEDKIIRFLQRIQTSLRANTDNCQQPADHPGPASP